MKKLPPGTAALRELYREYKSTSRKRGHGFDLTETEFRDLIQLPCGYCGAKPNRVRVSRRGTGKFRYTGIDRIDNTVGYMKGNVIPCCTTCNFWKKASTREEFLLHALAIIKKQSINLLDKGE